MCKDDMLPCGCGVKTDDAVYIYRKHYGLRGDEYLIIYKDVRLEYFSPVGESYDTAVEKMVERIKDHPEAALLRKAIRNAVYESSLYYRDWWVRCSRCRHSVDVGVFEPKIRCRIHRWCEIDCRDFEFKTGDQGG